MSSAVRQTWSPATAEYQMVLAELKESVAACMQCGTCTASCPNGFAMDVSPRRMWRMIQFGMLDQILESRTFWFCSSCYLCTLRCPRGLKLTAAMSALKRLAQLDGSRQAKKNGAFYQAFMEDVETYGRVQETSMMSRYFFKRMDPRLPLSFASMGMKMMAKGKLHLPNGAQRGLLKPMFAKAREMEAGS